MAILIPYVPAARPLAVTPVSPAPLPTLVTVALPGSVCPAAAPAQPQVAKAA